MSKISIVTVTHDTPDFIKLCIKAVKARTQVPYKHIIIDNGSSHQTIEFLRSEAADGNIALHERQLPKKSGGHAASLDWMLYKVGMKTGFVCLLDSDAYPIKDGWLRELYDMMKESNSDAIGYAHFRDQQLLHPSCMLFKYTHLMQTSRPSFRIRRTPRVFNDTGMIVCATMKKNGSVLHPLSKEWMEENICRHRWCATRAEIAKDGKLDDHLPLSEFHAESREWFNHPTAQEIIRTY